MIYYIKVQTIFCFLEDVTSVLPCVFTHQCYSPVLDKPVYRWTRPPSLGRQSMYKTNAMHGYGAMAALFSSYSKFLGRRDTVCNAVMVNEAFQNPTHGSAGCSSAERTNRCPFLDDVLRNGAISGVQV